MHCVDVCSMYYVQVQRCVLIILPENADRCPQFLRIVLLQKYHANWYIQIETRGCMYSFKLPWLSCKHDYMYIGHLYLLPIYLNIVLISITVVIQYKYLGNRIRSTRK